MVLLSCTSFRTSPFLCGPFPTLCPQGACPPTCRLAELTGCWDYFSAWMLGNRSEHLCGSFHLPCQGLG